MWLWFLKLLKAVERYFAETLNNPISHPEETKLDQVLQETQRSRQMTNQITQRIFPVHPGHGCQQEVLPCGEKVTEQKHRSLV